MVLEPQQPAPPSLPSPEPVSPRLRVRIRFVKGGTLRLVSHHDLMHCFERMLRRAELSVLTTQGFNPRPRMLFPLSLALGIVGREEVVELDLAVRTEVEEIHARLASQAPPGLEILSVREIDPKRRGQPRRAGYRVALPPERRADLPQRIADLMQATECWIERTRPEPRRLDVRPYLCDLAVRDDFLEILLWVTPYGTARPEEVLGLLGLADLTENGTIIERSRLELEDEIEASSAAPPLPGRSEAVSPAGRRARSKGETASQPAPLLPGPLSFDS